jgi:hypothetical protein
VSTATFFLQGKEKHKYKKVIFEWTLKVISELYSIPIMFILTYSNLQMIGLSHWQIITDLVLRLVGSISLHLEFVGFDLVQRILSLDITRCRQCAGVLEWNLVEGHIQSEMSFSGQRRMKGS